MVPITAHNHGSMPFTMGQLMVFRREAIRAIGGLASAEGQLVDDMYLGERLTQAGYRNVVSDHAVPIIQQGLGLTEFPSTCMRWLTFSRSGLPGLAFKVMSAPLVLAWILTRREVTWRGRRYSLDAAARLATPVSVRQAVAPPSAAEQ